MSQNVGAGYDDPQAGNSEGWAGNGQGEKGPGDRVKTLLTMTNDHESAPLGKDQPFIPPGRGDMPLPPRPSSVTVAAALWMILGMTLVLGVLTLPWTTFLVYEIPTRIILFGYGATMVISAGRMLRGSDRARFTVTVMGCLLLSASGTPCSSFRH